MITKPFLRMSLVATTLSFCAAAQDLGGGAPGPHGYVSGFQLDHWIPGTTTQFRFVNLPPSAFLKWGMLSFASGAVQHPALSGTLVPSPASPTFGSFAMGTTTPINLPAFLDGSSFYIQGVYFDLVGGLITTDATQVNLFDPLTAVGTGLGETIELFDEQGQSVTQTVSNSRNGRIHFTPDRSRAYVTQRDASVRVYALAAGTLSPMGSIPLSHSPRQGKGAISRDGTRLYLPVQEGLAPHRNYISVSDIDPASATYNSEIDLIAVPVIGFGGAGPGNGPMSCAITPDGSKLFLAYGQLGSNNTAQVGVLDLPPSGPNSFRTINVTTGGDFAGINVLQHIEVSEDGEWVYTIEQGFDPALPLVNGYAPATGGAMLSVIYVPIELEVASIPTGGIGQFEFARDLCGRNLWVGQLRHDRVAEAVCIDIDRNSPTRFAVKQRVVLDPAPYSAGLSGPLGIAVTPDGGRVVVALAGDSLHPSDQVATVDGHTFSLLGVQTISAADAETVSIQRY